MEFESQLLQYIIYMYIYCKWMVLYHRTLDGLHKTQSPTRSTNSRKVLEDVQVQKPVQCHAS